MTTTELSPDILQFNILPRLPAKCVGRFRCVSKEWQSFLTTTHFPKMQILHNDDQKLLLLSSTSPYTFRTMDCETPNKDGLSASRHLPFKEVGSCRSIHMWTVASLHGLVCIQRGRFHEATKTKYTDLILWNPLTSDYKTLSKPNCDTDCFFIDYEGRFGLYYDEDYKLLCVTNHTNPMVYIYSLKSDSWRKVETTNSTFTSNCIYSVVLMIPSVLLNEKLYFLKQKQLQYGEDPSYVIMVFDTKTEKLREIATPHLGKEERTECMSFMIVQGSIHCRVRVPYTHSYRKIELWRMDEDGDGDWTKLITYSAIEHLWCREKPLHIMRNGDWLMYDCFQGHVLQRDMNMHSYIVICRIESLEINLGWKYMETLVSPNQYIN